MAEEIKQPKKKKIKIEAEKSSEPKIIAEDKAIKEKKMHTAEQLVCAIEDLALHIDNAYFRHPFNKCPDCNKGNNTIMAHFGINGTNKIGNLKGFEAIVGDVISWNSDTYKGISIVKAKSNGIFELETSPFHAPRKEPAIVERMVIPSKYRPIISEMAQFLANGTEECQELIKIGNGAYPSVIAEKL